MMGSHLYDALKDTDVIPTYYNSTLDSREDIVDDMEVLDVLNKDNVRRVLSFYKQDIIYHLAAQSSCLLYTSPSTRDQRG